MRMVIVGASRFGMATARQAIKQGHEVVIVDKDAAWLEEIADEMDCGLIHGDGTLPTVQRDAFADHADALVLLTNEDEVNIVAAAVGRSVGFERVVPQIVRSELLAVCEELGLKDLITPHDTVARSIMGALERKDDASLDLRVHEGFHVLGYEIGERLAGQAVGALTLPEPTRVIAVSRAGTDSGVDELVTPETTLGRGDRLIVAVGNEAREEMAELFATDVG